MEISFPFATQNDLPKIVQIYNQAVPTRQSTADLEPVTVADRQAWFDSHNQQHRPLWLIKADGNTVGWISLADFYGRIAYDHTVEISIYLDTDYRGHHLGTQALKFVESQTGNFEIKTILAYVFGHNHPSQKLFKQFNYEQWAFLPEIAEMDGINRDLVILGKKF
ncbi:sortase related acyltransferase [Paucilactobacillus oligofermentans DSM 15707 = LMG 22743]|uniref:Sortase related acyltransferase n=1 Tax=Paucilactobacillus oligofermentans DSM 15707 = LMG 22743 TaxID=1423778 RepID=A0A0R1RFA0_9LACO|nr:GNAT family N-acetyltransferase [Paucilactobacillus oligofermentans]KRL55559.1 sortase related acyltransferase [Paucilactobacillus oligofermentans DSM 15707 = LMG 22743]CUS25453.1 Putative phosphinothricin N-acetyltransferase [Paucilactobacillus oligofermentans DSM 15707 = LMG 22743]